MILKRILGVVILLIGLLGLALSAAGTVYGHRLIDSMGNGLDSSLDLASQSLDTAKETLLLAKTTLGQVNEGLDTVESSALDIAQTISQTRPLLGKIAQVASHDVPDGVEAFQATMSDMAQAAAVVDETLATLSNLRFEQTIFGFPIRFDLDINYAPEVPFEESVNRIVASLEGLPPRLRNLEAYIYVTDHNLEMISQDVLTVSGDLDAINRSIADVAPLLDEYVRLVTEVNGSIQQTRDTLPQQLGMAKLVVTIVMVWIGLMQVAPLYLGWELVSGRRSDR
jgi:methyl-accepting chemotaxis protein